MPREAPTSDKPRPILVTGSHRSGTTWVGKMLALANGVGYIHEPFNPLSAPQIGPLANGFTHVHAGNADQFRSSIDRVLQFRWGRNILQADDVKDVLRISRDRMSSGWNRFRGARPLVKDPMAIMSAEWLASTYDMDVVVTVRHPAAFAASLLRLNWRYDFASLLRQEELMQTLLEPMEVDIRRQIRNPEDFIGEAALLWRIIHFVILGYQRRHPDWIVVRHEDLSQRPVEEFTDIYSRLHLPFTRRVEATIRATSEANPTVPRRDVVHGIRRDSLKATQRWRQELAPEEVERLRRATESVARDFYPATVW